MKKVILALSFFSIAAFAETWSGTVVDVNCKGKDLGKPHQGLRAGLRKERVWACNRRWKVPEV